MITSTLESGGIITPEERGIIEGENLSFTDTHKSTLPYVVDLIK